MSRPCWFATLPPRTRSRQAAATPFAPNLAIRLPGTGPWAALRAVRRSPRSRPAGCTKLTAPEYPLISWYDTLYGRAVREWQARSLEEAKCGRIDGGSGTFTRMDSSRLTTSERRILTLLYQRQPLSKRQLVDGARLGWATVVKMLDRLISYGLVESVGKEVSTGRRASPQESLASVVPAHWLSE